MFHVKHSVYWEKKVFHVKHLSSLEFLFTVLYALSYILLISAAGKIPFLHEISSDPVLQFMESSAFFKLRI